MAPSLHLGGSKKMLSSGIRRHGRVVCVRPCAVVMNPTAPTQGSPATAANQLEALKAMSLVVADTGELALVKQYRPVDCTTNPSLVYQAVQNKDYEHLLADAIQADKDLKGKYPPDVNRPYSGIADILTVNMGAEMLKVIPGRVSTEVDAHLSYDTEATYLKALKLVELYDKLGVDTSRIYIKIASTWEGIQAARRLEKQGIACNLTLLFSFAQAAACADAGASLISPFVGRIMDWYKAKEGRDFASHEDPGVLSVQKIYKYYKANNYKTIVMAASFRNIGEIRELAGCDNITIAPKLLGELEKSTEPLPRKLSPNMDVTGVQARLDGMTKQQFDDMHNKDQMAVEKLAQGIESFAADQKKLEAMIEKLIK